MSERFVDMLRGGAWGILPRTLAALAEFSTIDPALPFLSIENLYARAMGAAPSPSRRSSSGAAVISIYGPIGKSTVSQVTEFFRSAMSSSVAAIVFEIDSPGGGVDGIPELADEIYAARGLKKTIAVANTTAASAAYWIAAACEELVVTTSGEIGSIGVFAAHEDISQLLDGIGVKMSLISAGKYKTEGNPYEPLSAGARADLQNAVDSFHSMFVNSVARGRNKTSAEVRFGFGQGRIVMASQAVAARMADRVATFDQTLSRFGAGSRQASRGLHGYRNLARELDLLIN